MGDMVDEETDLEKSLKKPHDHVDEQDEGDAFIQHHIQNADENIKKAKADSPFVAGDDLHQKDFNAELTEKEDVHSVGTEVLGSREQDKNYLEFKNSDLIRDVKDKGDKNFALSFFKDTFNYNSNTDFDRTFRGDTSNQIEASTGGKKVSTIPLLIRFSGHEMFYRSRWLRLGAGAGLGIGYNGGKGYFSDGSRSTANITLWTLPADVSLLAEIPMGIFKFSFFGGPSALGLIQNRSDLPDGNKRKNLRQASVGYFAGAKVGVSISDLLPSVSYDFFGSYQVTRYYLTFEARMQDYSNFKTPELSVTGTSYAVGFTFEYF